MSFHSRQPRPSALQPRLAGSLLVSATQDVGGPVTLPCRRTSSFLLLEVTGGSEFRPLTSAGETPNLQSLREARTMTSCGTATSLDRRRPALRRREGRRPTAVEARLAVADGCEMT